MLPCTTCMASHEALDDIDEGGFQEPINPAELKSKGEAILDQILKDPKAKLVDKIAAARTAIEVGRHNEKDNDPGTRTRAELEKSIHSRAKRLGFRFVTARSVKQKGAVGAT